MLQESWQRWLLVAPHSSSLKISMNLSFLIPYQLLHIWYYIGLLTFSLFLNLTISVRINNFDQYFRTIRRLVTISVTKLQTPTSELSLFLTKTPSPSVSVHSLHNQTKQVHFQTKREVGENFIFNALFIFSPKPVFLPIGKWVDGC